MRSTPEPIFPSIDALVDNRREAHSSFGSWNEHVEAVERYGAFRLADGTYTKGFRKHALVDYMEHYYQCRFEEYYKRVTCPLLMLAEEEWENEREEAAARGLAALADHAEIIQISGWVHPYGWLLDPEKACTAVLEFLREHTP
jgi:hypothetical protein